jgi:hypothetical protein
MAMIELDGEVAALDEVLCDIRFDCRLSPAPPSRADKPRFYVIADASRGQQRAVRSAMVLLSALDAIAQSGEFAGFRIVAAEERRLLDAWVRRGSALARRAPKRLPRSPARAALRPAVRA